MGRAASSLRIVPDLHVSDSYVEAARSRQSVGEEWEASTTEKVNKK